LFYFNPLRIGSKTTKKRKLVGVRYPCDKCEYATPFAHSPKENIATIHEGVRYPFDKCGHSATTAINLRTHIERFLEGVRYPCDIMRFLFNSSLWSKTSY